MGWTFINRPVAREDVPAFLKSEFEGERHEIVDCVVRNNEAYTAIRNKETGNVFGLVTLLKLKRNETGYKDISEDMGPIYFNCPKRILKKLSPTDNATSIAWRYGCIKKQPRLDRSVYDHVKSVFC